MNYDEFKRIRRRIKDPREWNKWYASASKQQIDEFMEWSKWQFDRGTYRLHLFAMFFFLGVIPCWGIVAILHIAGVF